jgi:hypothetical protein
VRDAAPEHVARAISHRIIAVQALYACGVALCVINTYWSIAFIVVLRLPFASRH